jgi:hypothetical protein
MQVVNAASGGASNLDATVSSRLAPTVAARTLDISATGEAGIDWANIGAPTTVVNLSGTLQSVSQVIASVSGAVGSVTGAVGSVTSVTAVAANAINAASLAADAVTEIVDGIIGRSMAKGTVATGATTSSVPTSVFTPAGVAIDQFVGRIILFDVTTITTGLRGCVRAITGSSAAALPVLTVAPLSATPVSGDTFLVI